MVRRNQVQVEHPTVDVDSLTTEQVNNVKSAISRDEVVGISDTAPVPAVAPSATPAPATAAPDTTQAAVPTPPSPKLDDDGQPISETVPYGRFEHERTRRKEADKKAVDLADRQTRLEERTNALLTVLKSAEQQQQAKPVPNKNENPLEYLDYLEKQVADINADRQQQARQRTEDQAWQRAYQAYNVDLQRVSREKPDFQKAAEYLVTARRRELSEFGVTDPFAQQDDINTIERQVLSYALSNNKSPAEILYNLAVQRGYQVAAAPAPPTLGAPTAPPITLPPTAPAAPAANVVTDIQKREATRQAAISLSGSGAPVATGEIGPQELIDMSDEAFAEYKKKTGQRAMAKVFGLH